MSGILLEMPWQLDSTPVSQPGGLTRSRHAEEDERATVEPVWKAKDFAPKIDYSGYESIHRQIGDLLSGDDVDDYGILRPKTHACVITFGVLYEALSRMIAVACQRPASALFPRGSVTTDESGGLRIEWSGNDRAVRLVISSDENGQSYIYHECGDEYGAERLVTGNSLARWLELLG